jgi:ubiquinone/menaquinone biosynthesis C-methylase UbiE
MFIEPEEVLNQIKLEPEMVVADFGAGGGGWTIPIAKIVDEGKVFALDILEEPLSVLKRKAEAEDLFNIQTKLVNLEKPEGSKIRAESVDFVIISNILFQADNKKAILKEAKRILKESGNILIIDWIKHDKFGPKEGEAISQEELEKIAKEMGLKIVEELDGGDYHYALLFKK